MLKSSYMASSLLAACSVLSLGIGAQAAFAQSVDASSPSATKGDQADIIVTATKRAESIQDVPATIAAFSQEDLASRKIEGLEDLITKCRR